jgi:UDP-N-acetylmuramoyl-tripeptide--D-alanyl-D-alanine ligase
MVGAVLAERFNVLKTQGNFNNEIGLPLTLLQLQPGHEAAVLEMGMRGLKEIDALCRIARPTAGIITNIGVTHYELLGSVENIARAKGELLEHVPVSGFCLLNAEDGWSRRLSALCRGKVLFYGFDSHVQIRASALKNMEQGISFILTADAGQVEVHLPLPGEHNVLNALAAAGVGLELGLTLQEIAAGLANVKLSAMRLATVPGIKGSTIINDAYNANPGSTKASLNILATQKKHRAIAVLGNMRELGNIEVEGHREVGEYVADLGVDYLLAVGDLARYIAEGALAAGMSADRVFTYSNNDEAKRHLFELLEPGDLVLVKGSRAVKMEEIVEFVADTGGK